MTMAHELGHNLGVSHAGGRTSSGSYQDYQDDALVRELTLPLHQTSHLYLT